jgi:hypothetical protein
VEAGFDGDLQELKNQLEKGYHLESVDGRKHTALSEAACQGHVEVMKYLLEIGADPNSVSDTGRSPLWRAAFNGHTEVQYSVQIFFSKIGVLCFVFVAGSRIHVSCVCCTMLCLFIQRAGAEFAAPLDLCFYSTRVL